MNGSGIYCIRNLASGMSYIGQAKNFARRWRSHRSSLNLQKYENPRLQLAWNKHGGRTFVFEVLEECDSGTLTEREQTWLDSLWSTGLLYNLDHIAGVPPSWLGKKHTPLTCLKISMSNRGRTHTPETRRKISESHIGKTPSLQTRAKLVLARAGKRPALGKRHSEETRKKMSLAHQGKARKPHSPEARFRMSLAAKRRWAREKNNE